MSFVERFNQLPEERSPLLRRFEGLLDAGVDLESLAGEAASLTRQHFGRTMRLFAPLYVSNECVNICKYCGFSRDNPILRVTLGVDQVEMEARHLVAEGFRNILLVAGEHPKFVSESYLEDCIRRIRPLVPSISLEVGPMETVEYEPLVRAGAEGLVVYQETYDRQAYAELHTAGPKRNFDWRLECPERAYAAGFRRIGIGALFGLADWRQEARALAAHAEYLLKSCWKASLTISFPRLRPAAGEFEPRVVLTDAELTRLICAFRVCFPQVGLVLSTREPAKLRDGLIPLGVTLMSAGSHTEPGGYTGAGREQLHRTEKGKMIPLIASEGEYATEQFAISDQRSAGEIVARLQGMGFDPVWKDWDSALGGVPIRG
ncbi:MAG: 2-iminoacetate synthase ThiH [Blastochloris sp.]|nr:2-iminoacetate synthase ThiH [Blastochloris sp.]